MSNDELQRAIDDITQGDAGMSAPTTPVMGGDNENEQLVNEFGGSELTAGAGDTAPIMPATPSFATEVPSDSGTAQTALETAPVASQSDFSANMSSVDAKEEVPEVEVPEVEKIDEVVSTPEIPAPEKEEKTEGNLEEVKKNALKELYPLLKNMNINPEQAFEICKEVAEMGEEGAFSEAFEAAKKITDDNKRANALFEIVQMIDK